MRSSPIIRNCVFVVLTLAFGILFPAEQTTGQSPEGSQTAHQSIDVFLENYLGPPSSTENTGKRYATALVDLRDDGKKEVIVYIMDNDWCGTGGCTTLILEPADSLYRIVTKMTVVQLPIRVLKSKTNGWHDLGVWVQRGGIQSGYESKLAFDGETYPGNPTLVEPPIAKKKAPGKVVIADKATR